MLPDRIETGAASRVIDIPGYRVVKALGRGGMASVFLAMQESVQREVAIKVLAPTLMGDPSFGERFLREARIAAKLRHPHVVQVHDVGVSGACHYIAMEYLPGGPVLRRDQPPRGMRFALQACREIASALGYAHARGVIHRDIKPDNILLREDGAAVLTDFGIARASDNVRMTMTGSIMGTPSYMSPEQARGHELDGRSDLYSLGVVFYELLTGDVPYTAADSLSVGIMHITHPVPQLPHELSWLQPIINRCLAKDAPARYQTGDEFAQVLAEIEQGLTPTPIRMPPNTTMAPDVRVASDGEPTLGKVDPSLINSRIRPRSKERNGRRGSFGWAGWVVALVVLLGSLGWHFQDDLRALWPQSRTQTLLQEAEAALAEGRLQSTASGRGAQELFDAVQLIDPDNQEARQGLARVGERWIGEALLSAQSGDKQSARLALERAKALGVPQTRIDEISARLDKDSDLEQTVARWLEQAATAKSQGRLYDGDNSALALFERVLEVDESNAIARSGRSEVLNAMSAEVRELLRRNQVELASERVRSIAESVASHPDLPALQAEISAAQRAGDQSLEKSLQQAEQLIRRGALTAPAGNNALELYESILRERPGHEAAEQGIRRIRQTLMSNFDRAVSEFEFERAEGLLASAELAGLGRRDAASARERMSTAERRAEAMQSRMAADRDPARLRRLLDEAASAMQAGKLMAPPGESAYDKYRQVQSADPKNAEAASGMAKIPVEARRRYDLAMQGGKLGEARGYLQALEALPSGDAGVPALKRALAKAYLGFANERLGANEIARAKTAFDTARELDPDNPDLIALQVRLEQLSGGR